LWITKPIHMKSKLNLKLAALVFIMAALIYSCSRRNDLLPGKTDPLLTPTELHKLNVQLENSADPEDEKMNDNLLMLSTAFTAISDNSELMEIVYDEATSNSGYVKYSDLIAIDSRFKTLLNAELAKDFCPDPLGSPTDAYESISDSMIYDSVQYYPSIYMPNIRSANLESLPFVCIGAEIDDYDNILAFRFSEEDAIEESTLNEEEALEESAPVIIFTNGTDHIETVSDESAYYSGSDPNNPSPAADEIWKWDEILVKNGFRYEGTGKSEVRCMTTFHKSDGTYLSGGGSFQNGVEDSFIKKITNTDIANNTNQTGVNADVFPHALTVSTTNLTYYNYAYFTTYEYDWYASPKLVSSCGTLYSVSAFQHAPRMKYPNEWYHNSVCGLTVHDTWLNYVNATFTFGNYKSVAKIKRTQ
jgi:hypothetical protein